MKDVTTATTPISSAKTKACFLLNVVCQCVGALHCVRSVPTCILRLRMVVLPSPKCLTFGVAFHKKHGKSFLGAEFFCNKFREPRVFNMHLCDVEVRFCHPIISQGLKVSFGKARYAILSPLFAFCLCGSCRNPRFTAVTSLGLPFQDLELEGREGGEIGGPFVCKQVSTTIFLSFLFEICKVFVYIPFANLYPPNQPFLVQTPRFFPKTMSFGEPRTEELQK